MKIQLVMLLSVFFLFSCGKKENRWEVEIPPFGQEINIKDVSQAYFNPQVSNAELAQEYPDFFSAIPDSILTARRKDSVALVLNETVQKEFKNVSLQDSLQDIFKYIAYYYPAFKAPTVYTFTGELPYMNPVVYFGQSGDMVIGEDWFLGSDYPLYEEMGIPKYLRQNMKASAFKPVIAESIATQVVPFDIKKRKFVERIIYAGKILTAKKAFLPDVSNERIMGYTAEEWKWCEENQAEMYVYFSENELFFSDDNKLEERFISPAPFSKFFSDNDTESPGRVGAWMGWQICNAYLNQHPDVTLKEFLADTDYLKIFKESKYKPTN